MISVIIPARNEPYLQHTIDSILDNSVGEVEIIVVLDGYWPLVPLKNDIRVRILHKGEARGMRSAINSAVAMSMGEYLMKLDAHCMMAQGFDSVLLRDYQHETVLIPRRHRLKPETWTVDDEGRQPIDYEKLDADLCGRKDDDRQRKREHIPVDHTMTFQGSCWFMSLKYFDFLELMDEENYGSFYNEAQEICLKAWLSGGRCMVTKNTWYAHWHKDRRGYSLDSGEKERARSFVKTWNEKGWRKQTRDIQWLKDFFK